jgi:hypothetical protein
MHQIKIPPKEMSDRKKQKRKNRGIIKREGFPWIIGHSESLSLRKAFCQDYVLGTIAAKVQKFSRDKDK